ncbi:4-diphosphocytidyl-2-C-methyl-D-erythritol kinase [Pontibaca methylaminivorans]|uniref:4-diphosphocytidyl-2-C-methyl-D-erythritol kinase n=2 Tax=Pontibaca methylaminivorans TaxID=515897 RepID=A0A1R3WP20_9RHOB|nr:4-diphosphocytidyl-2-C-methyl-D-erythritol kinase [Pontibaca methylaminivorans]
MAGSELRAFAPAKVNLALHVTGRQADGYHLLDSLVVFADMGDRLVLRRGAGAGIQVSGPQARGVPDGPDNLALRAALESGARDVAIMLEKHIPAGAGLGGGSTDAAAVLRVLGHWGMQHPDPLALGADLPVCMAARAARMSGIGERIVPLGGIPPLPAVLVNPGISLATATVFGAIAGAFAAPIGPVPGFSGVEDCARWLRHQRNDLEPAARARVPMIGDCLAALDANGALLARMSGSGASCFGLFATNEAAKQAAGTLAVQNPDWWVHAVTLGSADSSRLVQEPPTA